MRAVDVYMRLSPSRRWYQCSDCGELKQPGRCACEELRRYGRQRAYTLFPDLDPQTKVWRWLHEELESE